MATLENEFNADEIPEDDHSFDPIPAGEYLMQVIESDVVETKNKTGYQLVLTLEVIDGPHANRRVWDRLNIRNQNPDAQRIAQRSLADLCLAIGISSLRNTEDLHFHPFIGKVTIQKDKTGEYGPQNRVRYKVRGGAAPARSTHAACVKSAESKQDARQTTASNTHTNSPSKGNAVGSRPWARQKVLSELNKGD